MMINNNIIQLLLKQKCIYGEEIAFEIYSGHRKIGKTYNEFYGDISYLVWWFKNQGVINRNIGLFADASYEWCVIYFAIIASCNTAVPIDPELCQEQYIKLYSDLELAYLFIAEKYSCFKPKFSFTEILDLYISIERPAEDVQIEIEDIKADAKAMIVFTSGSLGERKDVPLTNRNLCHDVIYSGILLGENSFTSGKNSMPLLPLYHMFGVIGGILVPLLFYGLKICIVNINQPMLKTLNLVKPQFLVIVPAIAESILKLLKMAQIDSAGIEDYFDEEIALISGGAYLDPNLVTEYEQLNICVLNGYGMTECSPVISCNNRKHIRYGSVGLVGIEPYCIPKIVNGELWVKGTIVFNGYLRPEYNKNAFCNGWFRTGDLAYIKDDYLYITGRIKNLIILKDGNNISPEEIESLIKKHPRVNDAVVYCKRQQNGNEILAALIELAEPNDGLEKEVHDYISKLNEGAPFYRRVKTLDFSNKINKTALGKVVRKSI